MIVIVVISILASITVVAYTGVQGKARDAIRMQHGRQIAQALSIYYTDHGNVIGSSEGAGRNGWGIGWFNKGGPNDPSPEVVDEAYTKSILDVLVEGGYLSPSVHDPSGASAFAAAEQAGQYAYMKYHCGDYTSATPTTAYIFLKLESISESERMTSEGLCPEGDDNIFVKSSFDNYGMNYWIKVGR